MVTANFSEMSLAAIPEIDTRLPWERPVIEKLEINQTETSSVDYQQQDGPGNYS